MLQQRREASTPFRSERFIVQESQFIGPSPWSQSKNATVQTQANITTESGEKSLYRSVCATASSSMENLLWLIDLHSSFWAMVAIAMFLAECVISNHWLRCTVTLSPLYPGPTICPLLPSTFAPMCRFIQKLPDGQTVCEQPFSNTFERFWRLVSVESDLYPENRERSSNLASESSGATIVRELTSLTHGRIPCPGNSEASVIACNLQKNIHINTPAVVLEEDTRLGQCWEFSGGAGQLAINLPGPAVISTIVIDYPSLTLLDPLARLRIPKKMSLWALADNNANDTVHSRSQPIMILPLSQFRIRSSQNTIFSHLQPSSPAPSNGSFIKIAEFYYDPLSWHTRQPFLVGRDSHFHTEVVALQIESNYGGDTTCLYWIGLYGRTYQDMY